MKNIVNPTGVDGIIVIDKFGVFKIIVPDEMVKEPGEAVKWWIVPPRNVTLAFKPKKSPFEWESEHSAPSGGVEITGTIRTDAVMGECYSYTVTDEDGNTIDPRIRIGKR